MFARLLKLIGAMVIICAGLVAQPPAANADFAGCTTQAHNPHIASASGGGPGGITAKATLDNCNHGHDYAEINLHLYKCDHDYGGTGAPSELWIFDNCDLIRWAFNRIDPHLAETKYVRQVPKRGSPELHDRGWYVSDVVFAVHRADGSTWSRGVESKVVFLDG